MLPRLSSIVRSKDATWGHVMKGAMTGQVQSVPLSPVLGHTSPQYVGVGGMVPVSRPQPGSTGGAGTRSAAAQPVVLQKVPSEGS